MYKIFLKRVFDIFFSLLLIVTLSFLMIILFMLVWLFIGFPIYSQKRPGLNNKIFIIYKFKTLYDDPSNKKESKRENFLGNFMRKFGLDELPQLFNILKNDMSFVGPRPLLMEYLSKYSDYEKKRHLVKPGITGLAQIYNISGKKKSWRKNFKLDVFYVSKLSIKLDLFILYKTVTLMISNKKKYNDYSKF